MDRECCGGGFDREGGGGGGLDRAGGGGGPVRLRPGGGGGGPPPPPRFPALALGTELKRLLLVFGTLKPTGLEPPLGAWGFLNPPGKSTAVRKTRPGIKIKN